MWKHWKALAAVGVVILVIAVAVVLLNPPAPAAKKDDPGALQASGKFGFPVSTIKIGEGGTKTASDSKTITGYNGTCDSAAQAAANYAPLLRDLNLTTWAQQKKTLTEVSTPGPWLATATLAGDTLTGLKEQPPGAFEGGWVQRADVAAGGMYRVASCEEKSKAVVQVFIGSLDGQTKSNPLASFGTITMQLGWEGDWKITDAMPKADDVSFGGRVKDSGPSGQNPKGPTGAIPALDNALIDWVFEDKTREGWIEYANAKR